MRVKSGSSFGEDEGEVGVLEGDAVVAGAVRRPVDALHEGEQLVEEVVALVRRQHGQQGVDARHGVWRQKAVNMSVNFKLNNSY